MQYTAIIKDGGLFIPNVFSDLNDGGSHIVQVEVDIAEVRQQLDASEAPRAPKKQVKKQTKKEVQKAAENADVSTLRKSALDELEALDDSELSEIFKAYMNDGQESSQISLENL
ncbi:hypothetical protein [Psychrobacter alimentarius]|uniref:hypothetical protein n=1 Tax=Psychrobacter alimentarius TaxID=261164 RepID=UPI003FB866AC